MPSSETRRLIFYRHTYYILTSKTSWQLVLFVYDSTWAKLSNSCTEPVDHKNKQIIKDERINQVSKERGCALFKYSKKEVLQMIRRVCYLFWW